MRLLITTIILTMLAQPVWAQSIEKLYLSCSSYAKSGFDFGNTQEEIIDAVICKTFINATISNAQSLCRTYQKIRARFEGSDELTQQVVVGYRIAAESWGTSASLNNANAAVQAFLNYSEKNPELWTQWATAYPWLSEAFPCNE